MRVAIADRGVIRHRVQHLFLEGIILPRHFWRLEAVHFLHRIFGHVNIFRVGTGVVDS